MQKHLFIYCPMRIIQIRLMPDETKLLYGIILTDAIQKGYSSMPNQELGNAVGWLSDTQVQNRLETFERHGYITCKVIKDEENEIIERRIYPDKEDLNSLKKFIKGRR